MTDDVAAIRDALEGQYDLVYRLSEYNATRRCGAGCDRDADFYLYTDGESNDFRCLEHAKTSSGNTT